MEDKIYAALSGITKEVWAEIANGSDLHKRLLAEILAGKLTG